MMLPIFDENGQMTEFGIKFCVIIVPIGYLVLLLMLAGVGFFVTSVK